MESEFQELAKLARDNGLIIKHTGDICRIELEDEVRFYVEVTYHERWSSAEYFERVLRPAKNALETKRH